MAQRKIAKTTLGLTAALLAAALTPTLATARSDAADAGAASLGATAAPRAVGAGLEGGRAGAHSRHRHAVARRSTRRHAHRSDHRLRDVSFEGSSLATLFGPGLYGRQTACGQVLTRQLAGVANRALPCGTLVEVSYEGKHLIVPVVDRGPYSSIGASWDLTERAAELLEIPETVHIQTRIVGHVKNSPALGLALGSGVPAESQLEERSRQTGATGGAAAS